VSDLAIILRDDARMLVKFSEEAQKLKDAALSAGALVGKVTNASEQNEAVSAQMELQRVLSTAEKARKAVKAPVLEYGKRIDAAAEAFCLELKEEMVRLSRLVGDFQQLELAKARAAEQARNAELLNLEREKAAELAKATSHESANAIQEHYNRMAETLPVREPTRAEGQRITQDWEITVTDIHLLYRMHSQCVELKPRLSEIKNLLKSGFEVKGVVAKPIVKAGVRIGAERKAIEI
jgi:hypothetical protein